jgi:hypothetical protein
MITIHSITLTTGTLVVTINTSVYTQAFNTDATTTLSDFITAFASTILTADLVTATSLNGVLSLSSESIFTSAISGSGDAVSSLLHPTINTSTLLTSTMWTRSNAITLNWTVGDGDKRIVVITPERSEDSTIILEYDYTIAMTTGDISVIINGTTYTQIFNGTTPVTLADFITTHAATILTNNSVAVTASGNLLNLISTVAGSLFTVTFSSTIVGSDITATLSPATATSNINIYTSTFLNPDVEEVRHNFPGYTPLDELTYYRNLESNNGGATCNPNLVYSPPYDTLPVDGIVYTANSLYTQGSQLLTELGEENGSYVVYDGIGNAVTILGLIPETTYYIKVYEYNINTTTNETYYLTTDTLQTPITTSCYKEKGNICFTITDCKTCKPIVAMVSIIGKCGNVLSYGSSDVCGFHRTLDLEIGSYRVEIVAANYSDYILNNVYIQGAPPVEVSTLHPDNTRRSVSVMQYNVFPDEINDNNYIIKM